MHFTTLAAGSTAFTVAAASLWVDQAPSSPIPYCIEHYATAQAVAIGQQIYRFPVTGPSSGGKFSLLSTSAPASGALGVLPHIHERHFENFFSYKGSAEVWASKDGSDNGRLLTPGDYGAVPRNTTHTFQFLSPDSELVGVISPGGFEDLFFFLADSNYTAATDTPYVPATTNDSSSAGPDAEFLALLEDYDVYAQTNYTPRRDFVNGSAPASDWHTGPNYLSNDSYTPYFIARDFGPKYLNSGAMYQIIQPFVTKVESADTNFTQGTITMSRLLNTTASDLLAITLDDSMAFEVLEGQVTLHMVNQTVNLIGGDVAFIPGGTSFKYWSNVAFTKFMYVGYGTDTLDEQLMAEAEDWDFAVFPTS